ncbi:COQ9 family protein [Rhodobacteraceae bacterium CCMM004]|nr:COQ9 family protein [Rhodobacteraceae bacterium CCMM004]
MTDAPDAVDPPVTDRLIDAALAHVPFDGWSPATLRRAAEDADVDLTVAHAVFPRGPVDMALAFHRRGDDAMAARIKAANLGEMKFRERVASAVRWRIEAVEDHKEAVRRGATLFALPQHAADGTRALWQTADRIWTELGDTASDVNWYTKRATLSGVYGSTVLYWLGDESLGNQATWGFLDRRIEDVMQIEKVKAAVNANPLLRAAFALPNWALSQVRAPMTPPKMGFPGQWRSPAARDGEERPQ